MSQKMFTFPKDRELLEKAKNLYLKAADNAEQNAGFSGLMSDGGASVMRKQVKAFMDGLDQVVPDFLAPYVTQIVRESDPEYAKYLELKKRFE